MIDWYTQLIQQGKAFRQSSMNSYRQPITYVIAECRMNT